MEFLIAPLGLPKYLYLRLVLYFAGGEDSLSKFDPAGTYGISIELTLTTFEVFVNGEAAFSKTATLWSNVHVFLGDGKVKELLLQALYFSFSGAAIFQLHFIFTFQ